MFGASKGFSFIELTVVILIIGIMATVAIPSFLRRNTAAWDEFTTQLNALVQVGSFDAMSDGKLRRVLFDFDNDQVALQVTNKPDADPQDANTPFVTEQSALADTAITWPVALEMRNFFIGKEDEIPGGSTKKVWFFIGPDGTVQDVTLVIFDSEQDRTMTLFTNPFTAQLTVYDGIKKP